MRPALQVPTIAHGHIHKGRYKRQSSRYRVDAFAQALEYMDRAVHLSRTDHDVRGTLAARLARQENDYGVYLMRNGSLDRG